MDVDPNIVEIPDSSNESDLEIIEPPSQYKIPKRKVKSYKNNDHRLPLINILSKIARSGVT